MGVSTLVQVRAMIKPRISSVWRLLLTSVCLLFFHGPAWGWESRSQDVIILTVPQTVAVDGSVVTLLHLFDYESLPQRLRTLMSRESIGEISQEGGRKYVYGEQLEVFMKGFLSSHGLEMARVKMDFPRQIIVERSSSAISRDEIMGLYKNHILEALGKSREDLIIKDVDCPESLSVPPGRRVSRVVARPGERYLGRVTLLVEFFVNDRKVSSVDVSATVSLFQAVAHTTRAVRRNAVIDFEDVDLRKIVITNSDQGLYSELESVVGMQATKNIGPLQPVQRGDLTNAVVLRRGDTVTIVYETSGFRVTARGQARQSGIQGQIIRVVNVESNRSVDCRVIDSETVMALR